MEKLKILLVDDEIDFVTTLVDRLSRRDYYVKFSTSAIEVMPFFTVTYSPPLLKNNLAQKVLFPHN